MAAPPVEGPPRRPQISRAFVEEHRRRRFVVAVAELLHEFGRQELSVATIVRLAGSARNSFYDTFANADECIAYGVEIAAADLFAPLGALDGEGDWATVLSEAIGDFYSAVAAEPLLAELLLIHSLACRSEAAREAWRAAPGHFARLLGRGRVEAEARGHRRLPPSSEEYFGQVIVSVAERRIRQDRVEELPGEGVGVAATIAGCYLGPEAASAALEAGPA